MTFDGFEAIDVQALTTLGIRPRMSLGPSRSTRNTLAKRASISCAERLRWPPLGAQSRKTRMYAWFQPLLIGDSTEERRQQISLLRAERHEERFLVVARDTANRFHGLASLVREVQGIATPVGRIGAPFNHAALFELVDQHDKSAGQDAEVFRERLLADPTGRVHHAQNAGMRR
jgi:hypothetical protein